MSAATHSALRLRVLDVGEGDASVLLLPDSQRALVVDAFDAQSVLDVLEKEGVNEVVLFLSHSDKDHIKGVRELVENFQGVFLAFFYNRDRLSSALMSEYRATLLALAKATRITPLSLS